MQPCGSGVVSCRVGAAVAPETGSHLHGFGPPACSRCCACASHSTVPVGTPGKGRGAASRRGAGVQDKHHGMAETAQLHLAGSCRHGAYREQPVPDLQAPVLLGSTSLDDLGDVDAVVPRDVLVPDAPCDAETQP